MRGALEPLGRRLGGDDRLAVLMSVAALASLGRERAAAAAAARLAARPLELAGAGDSRRLALALREGRHDGDARTHRALLEHAALRAWTARPADVDAALRARHRLTPGEAAPLPA